MSPSFRKKWPTLYGEMVVHGPPPYKNCPPQHFLATCTAFCIFTPQIWSSWGRSPTAVVVPGTQQRLIPPMPTPPCSCDGPPRGFSSCPAAWLWGIRVALGPWCPRRGDRSPGAFWRPAPLGSVDRWPLAIPETQIPGGSRPVGSAVRRRCPRGLDPSSEGHMPQPASAFTGAWSDHLCADWC
ncbi:unnamed protein product [Hapterophycus canaliculatus]